MIRRELHVSYPTTRHPVDGDEHLRGRRRSFLAVCGEILVSLLLVEEAFDALTLLAGHFVPPSSRVDRAAYSTADGKTA